MIFWIRIALVAPICCMLAAGPLRAEVCVSAAEEPDFAVQALKSTMMLTALTCGAQPKYNAVIRRFKADIHRSEIRVSHWFSQAYPREGQVRYDNFVSELANVQSLETARKLSEGYCSGAIKLFADILKLHRGPDLVTLAQSRGFPQPSEPARCPAEHAATIPATEVTSSPA